jgi:hypothetical protein
VVKAQCARYRQRGKPWHRPQLQNVNIQPMHAG